MAITMQPVRSSQIKAIGFDAATKKLAVQFNNGNVYQYADVPPETFTQMATAESIGKFFGANIKGKFEFERMPEGSV